MDPFAKSITRQEFELLVKMGWTHDEIAIAMPEELRDALRQERLVAAAPEMLAALESITNEVERRGMCINMATNDVLAIAFRDARAAIAKAEGR